MIGRTWSVNTYLVVCCVEWDLRRRKLEPGRNFLLQEPIKNRWITQFALTHNSLPKLKTRDSGGSCSRLIATEGHSRAVPSQVFFCAKKNCFRHITKPKLLPPWNFSPPNLKTWLQACRVRARVYWFTAVTFVVDHPGRTRAIWYQGIVAWHERSESSKFGLTAMNLCLPWRFDAFNYSSHELLFCTMRDVHIGWKCWQTAVVAKLNSATSTWSSWIHSDNCYSLRFIFPHFLKNRQKRRISHLLPVEKFKTCQSGQSSVRGASLRARVAFLNKLMAEYVSVSTAILTTALQRFVEARR